MVGRICRVLFHTTDQFFHPLKLQGRAKIAGEHLALRDQFSDILKIQFSLFQIFLQHPFVAHGEVFLKLSRILGFFKVQTIFIQPFL
ncbi:hypothetical protein EVA_05544 [gut metagenome]|uniref:Uncharacterized protein n=1 Tax=gut metagenome TaxID=749906 RepID=J9D199_9ZZZZ